MVRVVIIGAGFGGLAAAKRLAGKPVEVTLVDRQNHHLFQPLLYQVATAALSPADIAAPIRSIFSRQQNLRVVLDEVIGIEADRVRLGRGGSAPFDWLIIASGARHSYFGYDGWEAHAPGLKTIDDAIAIRRKVLLSLEHAETETDPDRRRALLTFVVIGGGPTGVELAGAIAELAQRSVSSDFRSITPRCSRILLVEAGQRVLPSFSPAMSARAERALGELGVEVRTGQAVTDIGSGRLMLGTERVEAGTIVWAAGVQASPAATWLGADADRNGRIVPGHANIFAIGDTARMPRPLPGIAPVAKQQGRYVADVILGRTTAPFVWHDTGNLATIGRRRAVIEWGRWRLSGFIAWLVWSVAHIWFLIGFRSRIAVSLNWLWNYLTYHRSARLITGKDVQ